MSLEELIDGILDSTTSQRKMISVAQVGFSPSTLHLLTHNRILSLDILKRFTSKDLLNIEGLCHSTLQEIRDKLALYGMYLEGEDPELHFKKKSEKEKPITRRLMDWLQTASIIATIIAGVYYLHRDLKADMEKQSARTDQLYQTFIENAKSQTDRTDRLYEMFIDLLKEGKK